MKNNRRLRISLITTLSVAVVFLLAAFAWRHFTPVAANAEPRAGTVIVAGGLVGDDYAPDRPITTTYDRVDQLEPSPQYAPDRRVTPRPSSQRTVQTKKENPTPPIEEDASSDDAVAAAQDESNTSLADANKDAPSDAASDVKDEESTPAPDASKPTAEPASVKPGTSGAKVQLFGTVEFKRPLSSLPNWLNLLKRNAKDPIFIPGKYFKKNVTWDSFKEKAQGKSPMELLRYVNTFWNTWPYKEDIVNWGVEDYWAIPAEFLKKSGDCEDYAIVKYFTLKELGIPYENMRIVVVRDTVRNLAHAVLAVYMDGDAYILDNLSNAVLSHSRIRQYSPQYSVNEVGRWAHLKGRKVR
ncbi:MAG: transglutaminase [Desulfovibrio sp. MES5]|uniref:transglutaminase-like cysteine peptidase n=1 Tax=Desulfovibrio sp. MES5 TaxID=1899016 RepID=UPI000B9D0C90|nr:transglutaminase-like cysteine peptidase [Desulfovibrio sp. MES5]OXS28529.1 MAG: transglutaminase [Desulfovibrio sp. MES5]